MSNYSSKFEIKKQLKDNELAVVLDDLFDRFEALNESKLMTFTYQNLINELILISKRLQNLYSHILKLSYQEFDITFNQILDSTLNYVDSLPNDFFE